MTTAYVLFADGVGVGILARQRQGYLFHASLAALADLDGTFYRRSRDARRAVFRQINLHRDARRTEESRADA